MNGIKKHLTPANIVKAFTAIIGLVASILALYLFIFQKNSIVYEILTNTSVFEVKADVGYLDITYNGESVKKNNEKIKIIDIKVLNNGSNSILNNYYDPKDPLGLTVSSGRIVEKPEITETSNGYLKSNVKPTLSSENKVTFPQVIMDPNDYFVVKLIILHSSKNEPKILPIGKVAGVKNIDTVNKYELYPSNPFLRFMSEIFKGDVVIQLIRILFYGLALIILIVSMLLLGDKISEMRKESRRKKYIKEFNAQYPKYSFEDENKVIESYIKKGEYSLNESVQLLSNTIKLNSAYKKCPVNTPKLPNPTYFRTLHICSTIENLISAGVVKKTGSDLAIDSKAKTGLDKLVKFLKKKGVNIESRDHYVVYEEDVHLRVTRKERDAK